MKKLLLFLFLYTTVFSSSAQEGKKRELYLPVKISAKDYLSNKIVFKLKEGASSETKLFSETTSVLKSAEVIKIDKKFRQLASKSKNSTLARVDKYGLDRVYEMTISQSANILEVINELLQNEDIEYAEPVYKYRAEYIPNDPAYTGNSQSYLNRIQAPQAWDLIRNIQKTIIAIVDSGSDLAHPDLQGNIFFNENDPINGIDDDGDGYVDNYRGWDFVGASDANIAEDNNPDITPTGSDHGVHVSGIASAVTDNARGVASVAFNSARLMILKVSADTKGDDIVRGYEGIKYAADHGAKIINCSWGGEGRSFFGQDVINYALSKGCLIVAAAGNSSNSEPQYPAAYEGVLAVANVMVNDIKSPSSNYGYYISLSAPGTSILSTTYQNTYNPKTGTSMASPVVASAAALLSAYLPHLTMQQVGEQLRVTTDNIDALNPSYVQQLGKGRLNVFRALTENPPSIKKQNIVLSDKGNGIIPAGDTLTIRVSLKNFLSSVNNLKVKLSSNDPNVVVTQSEQMVSTITSGETKENVGPFKVYIKPQTPDNSEIEFKLEYTANNSYQDFEGFIVTVARDYLNIQNDLIATTITSTGQIGFIEAGADIGTQGFQYKGQQLLYEAALMIGNSPSTVSNNARSTSDGSDDDFIKKSRVQPQETNEFISGKAGFDDSGSQDPLKVFVNQRSYLLKDTKSQKALITEYQLQNENNFNLTNIYVGLFMDWDINGGATNATVYDPATRMAWVYDKTNSSQPYAGVKLLSATSPAYYPLTNRLSNNILANDDFTISEKYTTLSSGIHSQSLGLNYTNGLDVSFVTGYGPYIIPANGSVKAAFALIGGDNLEDLKATAEAVQAEYETISENEQVAALTIIGYPNPLSGNQTVQRVKFNLPKTQHVSLDLFNTKGQLVKTFIKNAIYQKGEYTPVCNLDEMANGVYFYRLKADDEIKSLKVIIQR